MTSGRIIGFAAGLDLEDVPDAVRHEARRALCNIVGVAVGGSSLDASQISVRLATKLGDARHARAVGTGCWAAVDRVALVDGIMAHVLDFDDTHLPSVYHPSAPVFSALFPLAEWTGSSGRELLTAWVVGLEVGMRLALALGREHYDAGWHVTGTAGVVGAAAAAGRLLQLDEGRMAHCIGIAATQASGHREQFGSMTKSLHAGNAGASGLVAALLAEGGFTAAASSLDGRRGLFHVMSPNPDPKQLDSGLGSAWVLPENCIKPYASGVVTHPAIDGARALKEEYGVAPEEIDSLVLRVNPLVTELTGKDDPQTGLEGKFSVRHCAAVGFLFGAAGPPEFDDAVVRAPDVVGVRERIRVEPDPAIPHMQAVVEAGLRSGRTVRVDVVDARGTPGRPLTDDELAAKVDGLCAPVVGAERSRELRQRLIAVEEEGSIAPVVDLTVGL